MQHISVIFHPSSGICWYRDAEDGRFGQGEELGGEFGIGAIYQVFSFRRLHFVFGKMVLI